MNLKLPVPTGYPQPDEDRGVGDEGEGRVKGAECEAEGGGRGGLLPGGGQGGEGGGGRVGGEGGADARRLRLPQRDAAQLHQPKVEGEPRPGSEVERELELLAHNIIKRRC